MPLGKGSEVRKKVRSMTRGWRMGQQSGGWFRSWLKRMDQRVKKIGQEASKSKVK